MKKFIKEYLMEKYGYVKHDLDKFVKAINSTSRKYKLDKKDLFFYMIERRDTIPMATSYGFDTAYGREIRDTFSYNYYK